MTHRMKLLATMCVVLASVASDACAQTMPPHIKKALDRLVGDWTCKTDMGGETFSWGLTVKWSKGGEALIYEWAGTDIMTGDESSGTGIMGWDGAKKLIIELDLEASGAVYRATHHILENGKWVSPTSGISMIDGQPAHVESFRIIKLDSANQWTVTGTHRIVDGKPDAKDVTIFTRKKARKHQAKKH